MLAQIGMRQVLSFEVKVLNRLLIAPLGARRRPLEGPLQFCLSSQEERITNFDRPQSLAYHHRAYEDSVGGTDARSGSPHH